MMTIYTKVSHALIYSFTPPPSTPWTLLMIKSSLPCLSVAMLLGRTVESQSPPGGSWYTASASSAASSPSSNADSRKHCARPSPQVAQCPTASCHTDMLCPPPTGLDYCGESSAHWTAVRNRTNDSWSVCPSTDYSDLSRSIGPVAGCTGLFSSHRSWRALNLPWLVALESVVVVVEQGAVATLDYSLGVRGSEGNRRGGQNIRIHLNNPQFKSLTISGFVTTSFVL